MIRSVLHILNGERGLDTYPSVYNAMHVLEEQGYENHIYTAGAIVGFESIIKHCYRFKGGYLRRAFQLSQLVGNFDLVILYEPRDVEIYTLSRVLGARVRTKVLVHHSLEIPTELWCKSGIKAWAHRFLYNGYLNIDRLIIQDSTRKDLFLQYFPKLKSITCDYIPNSYIIDLEPVAKKLTWFDEVRKTNRKLITYTGAIDRWALSLELFDAIKQTKEVDFLFSGWSYDGFAQEAMDYCKDVNHIHFDLNLKSREELNYIVKNSDLGLAFYNSSDPNVAVIGMSSGKMHKFLSYGKPVVVNDILSIKEFLERNGFGVACHAQNISENISGIFNDYDSYEKRIIDNYPLLVNFRSEYKNFINSF